MKIYFAGNVALKREALILTRINKRLLTYYWMEVSDKNNQQKDSFEMIKEINENEK